MLISFIEQETAGTFFERVQLTQTVCIEELYTAAEKI